MGFAKSHRIESIGDTVPQSDLRLFFARKVQILVESGRSAGYSI
jgi:hypothetical protein